MERGGGLISRDDLAAYRAVWRDPITISYRGHTIYSMPPASSGGVTMGEILNIMEGYDPLPPFGSPALLHREAEAMRRAFTDRNRYLGDPAFVENPVERLLSKEYAARLRTEIGDRATPTPRFEPAATGGSSTTPVRLPGRTSTSISFSSSPVAITVARSLSGLPPGTLEKITVPSTPVSVRLSSKTSGSCAAWASTPTT